MKKNLFALAIGIFSILFATSCESDKPETGGGGSTTPTNEVSAWIYEKFQENYLWNVPTNVDNKLGPEEYFAQVKNSTDYISRLWNTTASQTSFDIGFEYAINHYQTDNKIYYIIYYVKPNTSAATADLKRGYIITKVNGDEPKSVDDAKTLMSEAIKAGNPITLTVMVPGGDRTLPFVVTPQVINENPVYFSQTSTVNGNKVGYILYNQFNPNYNKEIIDKLQEFYNNDINYLVLDLRYNNGGSSFTGIAIASAITKGVSTSDVFLLHKTREDLNDVPQNFVDKASGVSTSIPKLGDKLTKLYIITGKNTGATSEPFINSLRAYWGSNLVVVGDQTQGEGYLSFNGPIQKNEWSMLYAYSFIADKDGNYNYKSGITPNEAISEVNESNVSKILGDFGTENEAVYAKVISLISGLRSTSETYYNNNEVISSIQDKPFAGITFAN
ncbi:MAG: S41 family peptidase [Dysgonomonas sp.]|nr:S41 family peptidase [Dysgonomonas sp.]